MLCACAVLHSWHPGQWNDIVQHHSQALACRGIAGKLYLVDRQGQTQANIALGEVGIDLLDPDNFALDVLGDIMNGFGGRLFDELRSREVPMQCTPSHAVFVPPDALMPSPRGKSKVLCWLGPLTLLCLAYPEVYGR